MSSLALQLSYSPSFPYGRRLAPGTAARAERRFRLRAERILRRVRVTGSPSTQPSRASLPRAHQPRAASGEFAHGTSTRVVRSYLPPEISLRPRDPRTSAKCPRRRRIARHLNLATSRPTSRDELPRRGPPRPPRAVGDPRAVPISPPGRALASTRAELPPPRFRPARSPDPETCAPPHGSATGCAKTSATTSQSPSPSPRVVRILLRGASSTRAPSQARNASQPRPHDAPPPPPRPERGVPAPL